MFKSRMPPGGYVECLRAVVMSNASGRWFWAHRVVVRSPGGEPFSVMSNQDGEGEGRRNL